LGSPMRGGTGGGSPACSYPDNGRTLTDDAVDIFLATLTNGKVKEDKVGPHGDALAEFPYLVLARRTEHNGFMAAASGRLMTKFLAFVGRVAILGSIAAAIFFFGGYYSVAGTATDPEVVKWALSHVRDASAGSASSAITVMSATSTTTRSWSWHQTPRLRARGPHTDEPRSALGRRLK
jgi:hypothetical protein